MPQTSQSSTDPGTHRGRDAPSQRPNALTGVFRKLVEQHQQLAGLLQRLMRLESPESRRELWSEVRRELLSHERGEALEVYAALEGYDAGRGIIEQHYGQANEIESTINELDAIDYGAHEWGTKLLDVVALFEEHARDEEAEFFPQAQELLGEQAARELVEQFESAQNAARGTML